MGEKETLTDVKEVRHGAAFSNPSLPVTMSRSYPDCVSQQLKAISGFLSAEALKKELDSKELAKRANLTPVSVRSVLEGNTANIATYLMVIEALGLDLFEVCALVKAKAEAI